MANKTALFMHKQHGGVWVADDIEQHPGDIWFVSSTHTSASDAAGFGRSPNSPFATLDYAIGNCTASQGDVIYVMPGHAETYIATNGWDADVAGIAIIGLGWGANRPTFTFNHANAQVNIGASNIRIENLRFVTSITAVVSAVQVETQTDVVFRNCEWNWGGTTGDDFLISLELEGACDRCLIENCRFLAEPAVAGAATAIQITGGTAQNVMIRGCEFMGDYSTACVADTAAACQGLMFLDNLVYNADGGEPYIELQAATTGVIANTRGLASAATIAANAVGAAMAHCENFVVNTAGTYALIAGAGGVPAADAD